MIIKKKILKPNFIKTKVPLYLNKVKYISNLIKKNNLHSVCYEALCPNLLECYSNNTITFMILGSICTRKCSFCNIKHGKPNIPNILEFKKISKVINQLKLYYVVLTSVNRDDLIDGGAKYFSECIKYIRMNNSNIIIEILVPDFQNKIKIALKNIGKNLPNIFGHNLETTEKLHKKIKYGGNYIKSLKLLNKFNIKYPNIPTKSGLILGLGETNIDIIKSMKDLYNNGVNILTLGQYLQPSKKHLPVKRYLTLQDFAQLKKKALNIGFKYVFSGPLVRSSYNALNQFNNMLIK